MSEAVLWVIPLGLLACAMAAVPAGRRWGPAVGYPLGAALALGAVALGALAPQAAGEPVTASVEWLPRIGARFALRLDGLSTLFGLLVLVVGAVVLWYSPRYIADKPHHGRYYAGLTGFAAAMLLVVLADDLFLLYAGWEGTTLASFALIAHEPAGRPAARRALLVTFAGGLFLLAAVAVGATTAGTLSVADLTQPATWPAGAAPFLALLLVAAAAKSAQVPFHGWLPRAMVAPTPVSAYLHAAAMVKAGVYLLARFSGLLAEEPVIAALTIVVGGVTAVFAAGAALRRHDLKELLAYSTISQLGVMFALLGVATATAVAAAVLHAAAHALYKAGLFLVSGVTDQHAGTRDLRRLAGHGPQLPLASGAALLCAASMAGIPPALGYASKEEGLRALLDPSGAAEAAGLALVLVALVLTVGYALRIVEGFVRAAPDRSWRRPRAPRAMAAAPAALALGGIGAGVFVARLTGPVDEATVAAFGEGPHEKLGLWHGAGTVFWVSLAVVLAGVAVWAAVRLRVTLPALPPLGWRVAEAGRRWMGQLATGIDRGLGSTSRVGHVSVVLGILGLVLLVRVADAWATPGLPVGPVHRWVVMGLMLVTAAAIVRVRDRLAAVAMLAAVELLVAALYVLYGAPDLSMTQLVVSALAVTLIVFVFRKLPRSYAPTRRRQAVSAAGFALLVGGGLGAATYVASSPTPTAPAEHYVEAAPAEDADNVVNAILTDYRALDTVAETTVLAVAAIGVTVVIRARTRERS